jgi:hypothetical protein
MAAAVKIEFITISGVFTVQEDIAWPSVGDWQVCFFATLWPNERNRLSGPLRLKVARQWRFAESVGDKKAVMVELEKRAKLCGFGLIEIFSVSRVEALRIADCQLNPKTA